MGIYEKATRAEQLEEAVWRMKYLGMHENPIKELQEQGRLNYSDYNGILYWVEDEKWISLIKALEEKSGVLVYHVIRTAYEFGECLTMLCVSAEKEEWGLDRQYFEENAQIAYVENLDDKGSSEFGAVGLRPKFGGVVRTG